MLKDEIDTSRVTKMLNRAKPSNMDDEQKESVKKKIKRAAIVSSAGLLTVAVVATVKYYKSIPSDTDEIETAEEN